MNILELSEQELVRRGSLEQMRAMGIDPYPAAEYKVTGYTDEIRKNFDDNQVIIKSAAVADYKPKTYSDKKIKKNDDDLVIKLDRNKDIAYELGKIKKDKILVGFAAETNDIIENAKGKIQKKNFDFIVANDLTEEGAGFGTDTNIVKIIDKEGNINKYPQMKKDEVANVILDKVKSLLKK